MADYYVSPSQGNLASVHEASQGFERTPTYVLDKSNNQGFFGFLGNLAKGALNFISQNANPLSFISSAVGNILNYGHQIENYNYQKRLQQQIFDREDTAFSRLAKDYESAGFSPVFATGHSANSGSVVNTNAPQVNNDTLARVGVLNSLKMQKEEIANAKADRNYKEQQNALLRLKYKYLKSDFDRSLEYNQLNSEYRRRQIDKLTASIDLDKIMYVLKTKDVDSYDYKLALQTYNTIINPIISSGSKVLSSSISSGLV